jgi:dihydropteroate synthase
VNARFLFSPRLTYRVPLAHHGTLLLGERPLVMGILNVTPDSFAETTRLGTAAAIDRALAMQDAGADLLDIGGESTRPGAAPVSEADERARVMPVVRGLAGRVRVPVSVDTYKAAIAREAIEEGASMVNDVSGLQYDPQLAGVVARSGAALVLMHTRGRFTTMYADAVYDDLLPDVTAELLAAVERATAGGVAREQLILDPGIGFAKRPEHSYGVLAGLGVIGAASDRPLLAGPSRKSFMAAALDGRPPIERDWGTAAAVTAAVLAGAHIVRVHAVAQMVQVVRVAEAIRRAGHA